MICLIDVAFPLRVAKELLTGFLFNYSAESVKNKAVSFVADLEILRVSLDCGTKDVLAMLAFERVR